MDDSLDVLSSAYQDNHPNYPVMLETTLNDELTASQYFQLLKEKFPAGIPVVGWKTVHGMDQIWNRIEREDLLLNFQHLG